MELVALGKVAKPQGIKGEVKIQLYIDSNFDLSKVKRAYANNFGQLAVKHMRVNKGFAYVLFEGICTREQAETLRNCEISVEKQSIVFKDKTTFFVEDIVGSQIVDQNNNLVGELVDVEQYGAADVWVMRADGRNYMFPYIPKIVQKVLPNQKLIVVDANALEEARVCE
jgi:16S rRNA processing protein RimM